MQTHSSMQTVVLKLLQKAHTHSLIYDPTRTKLREQLSGSEDGDAREGKGVWGGGTTEECVSFALAGV